MKIMMIGGGIQEVKAIEYAHELGYEVLVTDKEPDAPCFKVADYCEQIDGRNVEALIACAIEHEIDGVFTFTELVTSVATVSEAYDLDYCRIAPAVMCQNKHLAKEAWMHCDIPTPRGYVAENKEQAKAILTDFGGIGFAKPLVGFGGIGAGKVEDVHQLFRNNKRVLIEEYIEGTHHDANALITRYNDFIPLGITDRYFEDKRPWEREIRYPSVLSNKVQHQIYDLLYRAAWVLGITKGPVKGDFILTDDGIKILEMAPRLHGPKNSLYVLPAVGIHPIEPLLQFITGATVDNPYKLPNSPTHCIMRVGHTRKFEDWKLATGYSFEECETKL